VGTGDAADADGNYGLSAHDDVIKSAGYRIGPFEVESCADDIRRCSKPRRREGG